MSLGVESHDEQRGSSDVVKPDAAADNDLFIETLAADTGVILDLAPESDYLSTAVARLETSLQPDIDVFTETVTLPSINNPIERDRLENIVKALKAGNGKRNEIVSAAVDQLKQELAEVKAAIPPEITDLVTENARLQAQLSAAQTELEAARGTIAESRTKLADKDIAIQQLVSKRGKEALRELGLVRFVRSIGSAAISPVLRRHA